jgi:hypothetical protein
MRKSIERAVDLAYSFALVSCRMKTTGREPGSCRKNKMDFGGVSSGAFHKKRLKYPDQLGTSMAKDLPKALNGRLLRKDLKVGIKYRSMRIGSIQLLARQTKTHFLSRVRLIYTSDRCFWTKNPYTALNPSPSLLRWRFPCWCSRCFR